MDKFKVRARALRGASPAAEFLLWRKLRNRRLSRWKFRRQHAIDRYIADFVTLDGKLIIEVDGATHSTPKEIAYDAQRTRILETLGFQVIRVTNDDVRSNIDGVLETILNELASR